MTDHVTPEQFMAIMYELLQEMNLLYKRANIKKEVVVPQLSVIVQKTHEQSFRLVSVMHKPKVFLWLKDDVLEIRVNGTQFYSYLYPQTAEKADDLTLFFKLPTVPQTSITISVRDYTNTFS